MYADIGGNLEEILQYIFQIPMMEKFEEQVSPFGETGSSPEDIL
jgi:hypothetical protein